MCNEVRALSIAMMEELAEEVQLRFPGEKVNAPLLITIYYAARLDHAKRLLAATNDIHNKELVNYLVNLRVELLQGHFDEPDKYIKHIWRSIFKNEAAECYSYRGNGRCKKRAIKNYIFTDIFRECFLQRFHHMDAVFFMERTMLFFNYVHNHMRKNLRNQQKRLEITKANNKQTEETIESETTMQEEQSFNGYEGSMLP